MTVSNDPGDVWSMNATSTAPSGSTLPASPALAVIDTVEPLNGGFDPDAPDDDIPHAIRTALFGQQTPDAQTMTGAPGQQPHTETFALLDAAKVTGLVELLESSELEHRCFFKGRPFEALKDVAPWLVRLEPGNRFTRYLFTDDPQGDVPWYLWRTNPGIFIRSQSGFEQVFKHFRKFIKVTDDTGAWLYVRMAEPAFWQGLIRPEAAAEGFGARLLAGGHQVLWRDGPRFHVYGPGRPDKVAGPAVLGPQTKVALDRAVAARNAREDIAAVCADCDIVAPDAALQDRLAQVRSWLITTGFRKTDARRAAMACLLRDYALEAARIPPETMQTLSNPAIGPSVRLWHLQQAGTAA